MMIKTIYDENGNELYREIISYYRDNLIKDICRVYLIYKNDEDDHYSTNDIPSIEAYNREGNLVHVRYINKNKIHRETGPALITYNDDDGDIIEEYYYINDIEISKELIEDYPDILTNKSLQRILL